MSYSFSFKAADKAAAKTQVLVELKKVVDAQPIHVRDQGAAVAAANAFIDLLADDASFGIAVSMNGSVSYPWNPEDPNGTTAPLSQTSVSVSVNHAAI